MCSRSVRVSYQNQTRTNRRSDTLNLAFRRGGAGGGTPLFGLTDLLWVFAAE